MLLRRCAWHKQYRGYGKLLGVSSWRGYGLAFSDGMCADCAARTREAWNLPPTGRLRTPRLGIPWATAAVGLAAAAVISGIVVGPVEHAIVPPTSSPEVAVDMTPEPVVAPPHFHAATPTPHQHAPRAVAAVTVDASAIFAPADARALTRPVAHGRISRARGRATAPTGYPSEPEPETRLIAALAEIDAEWSPNDVPIPVVHVDEAPPAALPHVVAVVESQAP